ncbi:MAG: hypothetical protein QW568_00705 [Candidatus Anstonellaceae archaeon]
MKLKDGKGEPLMQPGGKPAPFSIQPGAALLAKNIAGSLDSRVLQQISQISSLVMSASQRQHPANQLDLITAMEQVSVLLSEMAAKNSGKAAPVKHAFQPNLLAFEAANSLYPPDFHATLKLNLHEKCAELGISGQGALHLALPLTKENIEECLQMMCHSLLSYSPSKPLQRILDAKYLQKLADICATFPNEASPAITLANMGALMEGIADLTGEPVRAEYSYSGQTHILSINGESLVVSCSADAKGAAEAISAYNEQSNVNIPVPDFIELYASSPSQPLQMLAPGNRACRYFLKSKDKGGIVNIHLDDESASLRLLVHGNKFELLFSYPVRLSMAGELSPKNELWPAVRHMAAVILNRYDKDALESLPFIF